MFFTAQELNSSVNRFMARPANVLVPVALFVLLMPGLLVTSELSMEYPFLSMSQGVISSLAEVVDVLNLVLPSMTMNSVFTHALVYGVVYFLLRTKFVQFYY